MVVNLSAAVDFAANHIILTAFIVLLPLFLILSRRGGQDEPPWLGETIPFVTNTYQYMADTKTFMRRASDAMRNTNVVKCYLGPMRVYLIKGGQQVQTMFRTSSSMSSDKFIIMVMRDLQGCDEKDVAKWADDKSGRLKAPAPGCEDVPPERRYWYTLHHITTTGVSLVENTARLARLYTDFLGAALERQPRGEWATVRLFDLLRRDMCESATRSLCGTRFLEVNPGFVEQFWRFDKVSYQMMYGLPKWVNPKPAQERDRLLQMGEKFLDEVLPSFDWDAVDPDTYWDPVFGSSYTRDTQKWLVDQDMARRTRAAFFIFAIFGVNSNTIPVTAWYMMELLKDKSLFEAVRSEALQALETDAKTGEREFSVQKLVSMPLLQSVYIEIMRLHVSIGITREIMEDTVLDGYRLKKGSLIQAPTNLVDQDDDIWDQNGHKASEFWAERHVKNVTKVDGATGEVATEQQFVMAGKPSEFFPFGGGVSMCPGRHFAKQEILVTVAALVTRFDMEIVGWTHMDGRKSERPAKDNERYFGNAAVPPDRDVRVRWKRLW